MLINGELKVTHERPEADMQCHSSVAITLARADDQRRSMNEVARRGSQAIDVKERKGIRMKKGYCHGSNRDQCRASLKVERNKG